MSPSYSPYAHERPRRRRRRQPRDDHEPRAPPIRGHFLPALSLCLFVCTRPAPLSVSIWAQGLEIAPVPAPPVSLLAAPLPLAMSLQMRLAPDLPLLACSFSSIFSTRNCGGTMRREILATRDGRPAGVPTTRADRSLHESRRWQILIRRGSGGARECRIAAEAERRGASPREASEVPRHAPLARAEKPRRKSIQLDCRE